MNPNLHWVSFFKKLILFLVYKIKIILGLHCSVWAFLSTCREQGLLFILVHNFLIAVDSLVEQGSRHAGSQLWCTGLVAPEACNLPGPGIEPVSPVLAGGFFSTVPQGSPPLAS